MVFATDFDPTNASAHRKATEARVGQANISPVHQTNRLIAQAALQRTASASRMGGASIGDASDGQAIANRTSPLAGVATLPLKSKLNLPLRLQVLNWVQHGSTVVATVLIAGSLVLYGSSAYVDKSTDRALARLNHLQGESQQLTAANEAIKQSLAEQAMQENSGLEPYEAGDVLFVTPEPLRPAIAPAEAPPKKIRPLGY